MQAPKVPTIIFPKPRQTGNWWYVISTVVHVLFLGLLVWESTHSRFAEVIRMIELVPPDESRETPMRLMTPGQQRAQPSPGPVRERPADARVAIATPIIFPEVVPFGIEPRRDSVVLPPLVMGTRRRLGPAMGDGRLWTAPDSIPIEIGVLLDPMVVAANLDSVIVDRLMAYLASLGPDPFATPENPEWVAELGGQKWGIDEKWIHLGNLKLPTAILALLPIPGGTEQTLYQSQSAERVRQEIIETTRRMEDLEDMRRYIRELRERKDAEREANRRRREVAGDSVVAADSIIP